MYLTKPQTIKFINTAHDLNLLPYYHIGGNVISDFRDGDGYFKKTTTVGDYVFHTRSYNTFFNMHSRCNPDSRFQFNNPKYAGSTVSEEFYDFDEFCNWSRSQIGYYHKDDNGKHYQLDSDLFKVDNNKTYSPSTACYIPASVNTFLAHDKSSSSLLPTGVSLTPSNRFVAKIGKDNKQIHIGTYKTACEASNAYKQAKGVQAMALLSQYDGRLDRRVVDKIVEMYACAIVH